MTDDPHEVLTWADFGTAAHHLASTILADGYRPDLIVSVARGGLFTAAAIAYALDVKPLRVFNVEFYTGIEARLPEPVMLAPVPHQADFAGARVLIADDVTDTGRTLRLVRDYCATLATEVRAAVVYEKSHTEIRSDYVWKYTDAWIDFPWSSQGAVLI